MKTFFKRLLDQVITVTPATEKGAEILRQRGWKEVKDNKDNNE